VRTPDGHGTPKVPVHTPDQHPVASIAMLDLAVRTRCACGLVRDGPTQQRRRVARVREHETAGLESMAAHGVIVRGVLERS
jgi:hypothetical protein